MGWWFSLATFQGNKWKIDTKETPSCSIPHPQIAHTQQLDILVTALVNAIMQCRFKHFLDIISVWINRPAETKKELTWPFFPTWNSCSRGTISVGKYGDLCMLYRENLNFQSPWNASFWHFGRMIALLQMLSMPNLKENFLVTPLPLLHTIFFGYNSSTFEVIFCCMASNQIPPASLIHKMNETAIHGC